MSFEYDEEEGEGGKGSGEFVLDVSARTPHGNVGRHHHVSNSIFTSS
eukprot:CAMPEP_0118632732 /NCGR_PEP_ID=MMETSP0785-20121206/607_1 /TAXON_ID=91992 /ORGANISM="Bolidomonas pacifica, Strain CCMP 1866" /LENGTH=46 /DNA_ID= /DNA_START= /DNA_END= /DNA_ORIENTATION=